MCSSGPVQVLVYYDSFVAVGGCAVVNSLVPCGWRVSWQALADVYFRAAAHDAMSVHAVLPNVHAPRLHLLCCIA